MNTFRIELSEFELKLIRESLAETLQMIDAKIAKSIPETHLKQRKIYILRLFENLSKKGETR